MKLFPVVHGLIALACLGLVALLAVSPGGHPPAAIFIPFVLLGWPLLHGLLALIQWLERRGRELSPAIKPAGWPVVVILCALLQLLLAGSGLLMMLGASRQAPYLVALGLLLLGYAGSTLALILLRHRLAAMLACLGLFGWAAATPVLLMLNPSQLQQEPLSGLLQIIHAAGLAALGILMLRLPSVRMFFKQPG